jgi:hypothetical protein
MASDAGALPQIGYEFIIKAVRIAFECAFYGMFHSTPSTSMSLTDVLPPVGVYLLLISTSTVILWYVKHANI